MFKVHTTKWISLGLCAIALASCSNNEEPEPRPNPEEAVYKLRFKSNLQGMTRATETAFETGDEISLFAVAPGADESLITLAPEGNYIDNMKFVYNGDQFTSNPEIYKKDADKYAYFAVYPFMSAAGPEFEFTVNSDQSDEAAYKASDLCTATTGYTSEAVPTLSFSHRLSNLIIDLEGSNMGGNITVELPSVYTTTKVNLNNVTFETSGNRNSVVCNENGTNSWRAIIAPQTIPIDEDFLKVTMNGKVYNLKAPNTIKLTSGKKITVTLRVVNEELVVVTGEILPWDHEASIDYIIPQEILDEMDDYIDIYPGVNPPNIEGCYLVEPNVTVYCQDEGNGGYYPGDYVTSEYILFREQDMTKNTINYSQLYANFSGYSIGNGAFISGEGDNFTVYFDTEGATYDIYTRTALVISGTKTS